MFIKKITVTILLTLLVFNSFAIASPEMAIKELTVFKDGHCFVVHSQQLPIEHNQIKIDGLPSPVLGTFWALCPDGNVKLKSVTAGEFDSKKPIDATSVIQMLKANAGADIIVKETGDKHEYQAKILQIQDQQLAILQTSQGTKVLPVANIEQVTFIANPNLKYEKEEKTNGLRLAIETAGNITSTIVTMGYVQKGLRWIPSYKIDIDGHGKAKVVLQATLVNNLCDIENVHINLVVGVPEFDFKDLIDPISLKKTLVNAVNAATNNSRFDNMSNSLTFNGISSQMMHYNESSSPQIDSQQMVNEFNDSEDFFVFSIDNITLPKDGTMLVTLAEYELEYEDSFALDLNFSPPMDVRYSSNRYGNQNDNQLAKMLMADKVVKQLKIKNTSKYPFTTGPATISRKGQIVSQKLMKYTPIGATMELPISKAIDIAIVQDEIETGRISNSLKYLDYNYAMIDIAGTIKLINHKKYSVTIDISKYVMGSAVSAGETPGQTKGTYKALGPFNQMWQGDWQPQWWKWYSWPYWWNHVNK
ncbi:MAG: hypothetical protein JEZ07_15215 [Phycisphaerae bacterium]|nr:hypothetical protein [Phycisphaerae bacterium]